MEGSDADEDASAAAAATTTTPATSQRRSSRSRAPTRSIYDDALLQAWSEDNHKNKKAATAAAAAQTPAGTTTGRTTKPGSSTRSGSRTRAAAAATATSSSGGSSRRGTKKKEEESDEDEDEDEENSAANEGKVARLPSSGGRGSSPRRGKKEKQQPKESSDEEETGNSDDDEDKAGEDGKDEEEMGEEKESSSASSSSSSSSDDDDSSSDDSVVKRAMASKKRKAAATTTTASNKNTKPAGPAAKKTKKAAAAVAGSDDDEDSDDDDEDESPPGRAAVRFAKDTSFATAAAAAKPPVRKARPAAARHPGGGGGGGGGSLAAFARRVLHKDESPDTSLVASLWKVATVVHGGAKARPPARLLLPGGRQEHLRTSMLQDVAKRVVAEHANDPNGAEVRLLNLLFRSVGGTYENAIDPEKVELGDLSHGEWEKLVVALCLDMETTPAELVLLSADPLGAVHAASAASSKAGNRKNPTAPMTALYRQLYASFWHALGTVAVSDTIAAARGSGDGSDDDEDDDSVVPDAGHRFQMEAAKCILHRIIEVTGVGQPDIRLAAILAVYQMGVAMLERVQELEDKVEAAERQLKVANRIKSTKKADALSSQISRWSRTMKELQEHIDNAIVNNVFLDRYKDVNPHIRALSLETMARFALISPSTFLKGSYLKYSGWMLRDRDPTVRGTAIDALAAPLKAPEGEINTAPMQMVIDKFLDDIVSRSRDVDTSVQEKAMDLLLLLLQQGFLDTKSADDKIWSMVNLRALDPNTTPHVRRQGLYFVIEQLNGFASDAGKDGFVTESEAVAQLDELTSWVALTLSDSDIPIEHVRYEYVDLIVHSLRAMEEHKHLTTSWNAMLRPLEFDDKFVSEAQNKQVAVKHRVALRMFVCSAGIEGQFCSDVSPIAECMDPYLVAARRSTVEELDAAGTSRSNAKKLRAGDASMEMLNGVLLEKLPALLSTFKGDASMLRSLTTLAQYLSPQDFSPSSRKAAFLLLLRRISDVFLDSADDQVIANCAAALSAMAELKHPRTDDAILLLNETASKVRDRTLGLLKEKAKKETRSVSPDNDTSREDVQLSLCLCLRRLGALASRFDLIRALSNSKSSGLGKLCDLIGEDLTVELKALKVGGDGNLPSIWTDGDPGLHLLVADAFEEGLQFLLKVVAFRLKEVVEEGKTQDSVDLDSHEVLVMRHRLLKLLSLCFDVEDDGSSHGEDPNLQFTPEFTRFSHRLQCVAVSVLSDMRILLPVAWAHSTSPLLRACAMNFNEHGSFPNLLLAGSVRFLVQSGDAVCDTTEVNGKGVNDLLVATARGCLASWSVGSRSEGAYVLSHLSGRGHQAHDVVLHAGRIMRKVNASRLLESHYHLFLTKYESWLEELPCVDSDDLSEEALEKFHEEEQRHRTKREEMDALATKLASTLGVGRLSNAENELILERFVVKCITFALSPDDLNDDNPGERLGFLSLVSKYTTFVRTLRDARLLKNIRNTFDQKEAEFRSAVDFMYIDAPDRATLADFRKSIGLNEWDDSNSPESSRPSKPATGNSPSTAGGDGGGDDLDFSPGTKASTATRKSGRSRASHPSERSEGSAGYDPDNDRDAEALRGSKSQRSFTTVDGHGSDDGDDDVEEDSDDTEAMFSRKATQSVGSRSAGSRRNNKVPPPLRYKTGGDEDSTRVSRATTGSAGSPSVASSRKQRSSQYSGITAQILSRDMDASDGDDDQDEDGYGGEESHDESTSAAPSASATGAREGGRPIARRRNRG